MKKFIYKTILIALPIIVIPIVIVFYARLTPPRLSNSISFNAKILNIKKNIPADEVDVLAVGSSMSLNNIHNEIIKKYFGNNYVNMSSWGQNIDEDYNLIKTFTKHYKPRTILISSGLMDFNNYSKDIKYNLVDNFLFGNGMLAHKELNLTYVLKQSTTFIVSKNDTQNYTSLMYDKCGGVNFEKSNFKIDSMRWVGNKIKDMNLEERQYKYLDSISQFCSKNNMNLIFSQSPVREGYFNELDSESLNILNHHIAKVDSIISKNNQIFINTQNVVWPDNLYVDYSHFNEVGAKKYTNYFLENGITKKRINMK